MTDGVVIMPSFFEALKDLPDSDRLALYDAICKYGLFGEMPENLTSVQKALFVLMKPNIDSSQKRYKASKENGGKPPKPGSKPRGRPRKNQMKNQSENQTENQDIDLDSDNDIDSDTDSDFDSNTDFNSNVEADKSPRAPRFTAPTLGEVAEYCKERRNGIDAQHFLDYYTSNGWKVGRSPMKDWKAAVRNWERRDSAEATKAQQETTIAAFTPPEKRHEPYNLADMVEWPVGSNNYIPKSEAVKFGF